MSVSFVAQRNSRAHLENNTFILNKGVKSSVIWPIENTAKSMFRKKFVYITWPSPFSELCLAGRKNFLQVIIVSDCNLRK